MNLEPYVDAVRQELTTAAAAAGAEAQELADRLSATLDSAMRLALLEALSTAAEELTGELAPRTVEVRLRGRDPEFVVSGSLDEGGTWRVTLRLPEGLRSAVEAAARRDGASLNSWLVRAAAAACQHAPTHAAPTRPTRSSGHRVTGWVR
jgi:hypothetical protein